MKFFLKVTITITVGFIFLGSSTAIAGGGARIILRQNYHPHYGQPQLPGNGVVLNWLMKQGDSIIQSQFGGSSTTSAGINSTTQTPFTRPEHRTILNRLDRLNSTNSNNPATNNSGNQINSTLTPIPTVPNDAGLPEMYPTN